MIRKAGGKVLCSEYDRREAGSGGTMVDIKGRWALVTGAARGIGRGAALFLAERGCNLVLHGRTKEHCEKTAEEARKYGVEVITVGAEFSDLKQVEAMLSEIDATGRSHTGPNT